MHAGYLIVETHDGHPGYVRLRLSDCLPRTGDAESTGGEIQYIARFSDADAALMHAHECLRRCLVDLNNRIYRCDLLNAVADIEADSLGHKRVYLHPDLKNEAFSNRLAEKILFLKKRQDRINDLWQMVGRVSIALLLLNALFSL